MTELPLQVESFKRTIAQEAEELIRNVFPKKILELRDLCSSLEGNDVSSIRSDLNIPVPDPELFCRNCSEESRSKKRKLHNADRGEGSSSASSSRVLLLANGMSPVNSSIRELYDQLKPHIRDLMKHANVIKTWITLLIPKIEDGNNFGVSIQEETMAEASLVEKEAGVQLELILTYFLTRAKLICKVAKYPHIGDFRQAVHELDEKEFLTLRLTCCELRNAYTTLLDVIQKNIDKIKKPRNTNSEGMY